MIRSAGRQEPRLAIAAPAWVTPMDLSSSGEAANMEIALLLGLTGADPAVRQVAAHASRW
jgi:hypothetical protein